MRRSRSSRSRWRRQRRCRRPAGPLSRRHLSCSSPRCPAPPPPSALHQNVVIKPHIPCNTPTLDSKPRQNYPPPMQLVSPPPARHCPKGLTWRMWAVGSISPVSLVIVFVTRDLPRKLNARALLLLLLLLLLHCGGVPFDAPCMDWGFQRPCFAPMVGVGRAACCHMVCRRRVAVACRPACSGGSPVSFTGFGDVATVGEGRLVAASALLAGGLPAPGSRPSSAAAAMLYFGISASEVSLGPSSTLSKNKLS